MTLFMDKAVYTISFHAFNSFIAHSRSDLAEVTASKLNSVSKNLKLKSIHPRQYLENIEDNLILFYQNQFTRILKLK